MGDTDRTDGGDGEETGGFVFGTMEEGTPAASESETTIAVLRTVVLALAVVVVVALVFAVLGTIGGGVGPLGGAPSSPDGEVGVLTAVTTTDAPDSTSPPTSTAPGGVTTGIDGSPRANSTEGRRATPSDRSQVGKTTERTDPTRTGETARTGGAITGATTSQTDAGEATSLKSPGETGVPTDPGEASDGSVLETTVGDAESVEATSRARSPSVETFRLTQRRGDAGNATVLVVDWRVIDPNGDLDRVSVSLRAGDGRSPRTIDRAVSSVEGSTASARTTFAVDAPEGTAYRVTLSATDRAGTNTFRVERVVVGER